VLSDIRLLYERTGPEPPHEVIFVHQMASVLDQHKQRFEGFRRKRHGLAVEIQQTLPSVEAKRTEAVEMSCFLVHSPGKEFFKISSRFRKDF
jgi:hypothetical protein